MTERDRELDEALRRGLNKLDVPAADSAARKRAIGAAMAEFEAVHGPAESGRRNAGQGFLARLRPMVRKPTDNGSSLMPFKQRFIVTSITAALAGIVAVGVSLQYDSPVQPAAGVAQSSRAPAPAEQKKQGDASVDRALVADAEPVAAPAPELLAARQRMAKAEARADTIQHPPGGVTGLPAGASYGLTDSQGIPPAQYQEEGGDHFSAFEQNPVRLVSQAPVSTFSVDVDTASYSYVRRQLNQGVLPQGDAVRSEELINYFDYAYPLPQSRERPFRPSVIVTDSPWAPGRKLLQIGIKGFDLAGEEKPRSNLVFLLDVSGSMNSPDRLPLVKQSMALLLSTLKPDDTVAIAVYAGAAGVVLEPTPVQEKQKIIAAMNRLGAGGSTAGAQGIRLAYELAEANFDQRAVNRVILATDGDFNVGITSQRELQSFIERKRERGIYLSVLGFGQGNYQDALMQTLAQNGNGVAAYIDTLGEAQKVLVDEASSTLFPIARDVKIQVEFNPATVAEYRLIGYETRQLRREDFNNDAVDAGDIGAGHTVTAIYEFTPAGSGARYIEDSRYTPQAPAEADEDALAGEYAVLRIRYKLPAETTSRLITQPVSAAGDAARPAPGALQREADFAAAVAGFAQLLKGGRYTHAFSYDDVIALAQQAKGGDDYGYRTEFIQLVRKAKTASAMRAP